MSDLDSHFLLYSDVHRRNDGVAAWRFILESASGKERLAATDTEPSSGPERLELLAVVRGLEALEKPSRVTLLTKSRYVSHGLRRGMDEWRENGWRWERYGQRAMVRNADLWRRIDRAIQIHDVNIRNWRLEQAC